MINGLKLSVSAAALTLLVAGGVHAAKAADVVAEPACGLNGSVMAGYMYDWQKDKNKFDLSSEVSILDHFNANGDIDWETPFAEGAAVFTCGGLNIQGDFAWYHHSTRVDPGIDTKDDVDFDDTNTHAGGAVFFRDPNSWGGGISASAISQDLHDIGQIDLYRVGLFGEAYFGDVATLGASGHYYDTRDEDVGIRAHGFELAAWGRVYATPNFSLMVRGDLLLPEYDAHGAGSQGVDLDADDGYAITGEAEYLAWDRGLTIFGGARYAERSWNEEATGGPTPGKSDSDVEDFQVYAGLKFYFDFSSQKTLVEDHRTGAFDNTSVFHEKLPELFTSSQAGALKGYNPQTVF